MAESWTIGRVLDWSIGYLERANDKNPRLSAQILLAEATGMDRLHLYVNFDKPLTPQEKSKFRNYLSWRSKGQPIQYIIGHAPFYGNDISVCPGVLIPRPETEILIDEVLSLIKDKESNYLIADICTGSGCIAISLTLNLPNSKVFATDISEIACQCAKDNINNFGVGDKVSILNCNLANRIETQYENLLGSFDIVVSNPPYIPSEVIKTLDKEVSDYEPVKALDGGQSGLDFLEPILMFSKRALKPEGILALELYENNLDAASGIAKDMGFRNVEIKADLASRPRILLANN